MRWSFVLFFIVLLLVLGAANWHVHRWASEAFALPRRARRALAWIFGGSLAVMTFGRVIGKVTPTAVLAPVLAAASAVVLAVLISVVLLLAVDLARVLVAAARRLHAPFGSRRTPAPAPVEMFVAAEAPELPRRALLARAAAGSAFLIGSSSSLYGVLAGRHDYQVEEVPLRIPGLSQKLDGFTIVQLSDLHIGTFVGEPELRAALELVRGARPDLIVLTGDLLDNDAELAPRLGEFARRLGPLAREGVAAITGNHDYYAGVDPTVAALRAGGALVLRNEGRVLGGQSGLALLGVDDVQARRFEPGGGPSLDAALSSLSAAHGERAARDLPRVLLCHNPSFFERATGRVSLQLSGHTHGGQVNVGVRPADLFLKNGWVAGVYGDEASRLYVNRGFGTAGPPARVGSPPEISRIVLVSA